MGGEFVFALEKTVPIYIFKNLNVQVIFLIIYSAKFYCSHFIVAYKVYNTKWKISVYESFIHL